MNKSFFPSPNSGTNSSLKQLMLLNDEIMSLTHAFNNQEYHYQAIKLRLSKLIWQQQNKMPFEQYLQKNSQIKGFVDKQEISNDLINEQFLTQFHQNYLNGLFKQFYLSKICISKQIQNQQQLNFPQKLDKNCQLSNISSSKPFISYHDFSKLKKNLIQQKILRQKHANNCLTSQIKLLQKQLQSLQKYTQTEIVLQQKQPCISQGLIGSEQSIEQAQGPNIQSDSSLRNQIDIIGKLLLSKQQILSNLQAQAHQGGLRICQQQAHQLFLQRKKTLLSVRVDRLQKKWQKVCEQVKQHKKPTEKENEKDKENNRDSIISVGLKNLHEIQHLIKTQTTNHLTQRLRTCIPLP